MSLSVSGDSQQSLLVQLLLAANQQNNASSSSTTSATSSSSASNSSFAIDASNAVGLSPALINILAQFSSGSGQGSNGQAGPPPGPPPGASSASDATSSSDPSGIASLLSTLEADLANITTAFQSGSLAPTDSSSTNAPAPSWLPGSQTDPSGGSGATNDVSASDATSSTSSFGLRNFFSVLEAYASHGSSAATSDNSGSA